MNFSEIFFYAYCGFCVAFAYHTWAYNRWNKKRAELFKVAYNLSLTYAEEKRVSQGYKALYEREKQLSQELIERIDLLAKGKTHE